MVRIKTVVASGSPSVGSKKSSGFAGFMAWTAVLGLSSWLPVPVTAAMGSKTGWLVTLSAATIIVFATWRMRISLLLSALLVSSALVATGLVRSASQYMPVAVVALPVLVRWSVELVQARARPATPPLPVLLLLMAYLGWALLASVFSIDIRQSLTYVAGMVGVITIAFFVAPAVLADELDGRRVLGVVVAMGVIVAAFNHLLAITGPLQPLGTPMGDYIWTHVVLGGHATPVVVPKVVKGVFTFPNPEISVVVAGLVGCIAIQASASGISRTLSWVGIPFLTVALLTSQARNGLLMGAVACAGMGLGIWLQRRIVDRWALASTVVLAATLLLMLANVVGTTVSSPPSQRAESQVNVTTNAAPDETHSTADTSTLTNSSEGLTVSSRGGTGLSGRDALWRASVSAIVSRPIFGHGLGSDATAIAPWLNGEERFRRGLTSHETWLRTAVEIGLPGLLALVGVVVTVGVVVAREFIADNRRFSSDLTLATVVATAAALTIGQFFDTSLLGGIAIHNMYWTLSLGFLALPKPSARS